MVRGDNDYATNRSFIINLDNVQWIQIEDEYWEQLEDGAVPTKCGRIEFNFHNADDSLEFILQHGKAKKGYETFEEVLERLERLLNE